MIAVGTKVVQHGIGCIGEVVKIKSERAFVKFGPYACDHEWLALVALEEASIFELKNEVRKAGILFEVRNLYNQVQAATGLVARPTKPELMNEQQRHKLAIQCVANFLRGYFSTDKISDAAVDTYLSEVGL